MKKFFSCALFAVVVCAAHAQTCSELFISEYVEGSGFNKALEIFNPSDSAVALGNYKLQLYVNGSPTAGTTFTLTGTLAAGGVYVIANSQADSLLKLTADSLNNSITNFNGDDAITLLNDTIIIDQIGVIGTDPGSGWPVGAGSTDNHTLVRKPSVQGGSTNWTTGATEWNVLPIDSFQLGAHTMTPCGVIAIRFATVAASVNEAASTYSVDLLLNQGPTTGQTIDVTLKSGDAADVGNFAPISIPIPADSTSATFTITVTNDTLSEATEQVQFLLSNPSSGILVDADSIFTLTITDDDSTLPPPPFYQIAAVRTVDSTGVPDSNNVQCMLSGTVYGINLRNTGLQFTIHDATGGIGLFSSAKNFGYTVQEGDSIVVSGHISHFLGLAQIVADTVYEVGTGTLEQPANTTVLDESTESELMRINNVWLVDANQWDTTSANGFAVDITNGTQTFEMRIEEQVDLFHTAAPTSHFDVIGLGGQFDSASPFTEGYQILPRYSDDLILHTGIAAGPENNFVVYPNPTQGVFTIKLSEPSAKEITIRVADLAGHVVMLEKKRMAESTIRVDASALARGLYIVEITAPNSVQWQKVSIQ